jgi:hypothetical protein
MEMIPWNRASLWVNGERVVLRSPAHPRYNTEVKNSLVCDPLLVCDESQKAIFFGDLLSFLSVYT